MAADRPARGIAAIFTGRSAARVAVHAGGTLAGSVAQLVAIGLVARLCDDSRWALVMELLAAVAMFEVASDFGGRFWYGERFALGGDTKRLMRLALLHKAVWSLAALAVALVLMPDSVPRPLIALAALVGYSQPMSDPLLWMLRATGRTDREAGAALASRLAAIAGFCGLAIAGAPMWMACTAWLATNLARFAALRAVGAPLPPIVVPSAEIDPPRLRDSLVQAFPLGGAMVLQSLQNRIGTFLVGDGCDPRVVGEFASVFSLVAASSFVGTSVTATMFGALVEGAKAEQAGGRDASVRQLLARLRLVLVTVSVVGIVVSPFAIPVFLGHRSDGALLAALVLWTGLYFSVAQFNLRLSMSARGKSGWDAAAMVAGLVVLFATHFVPVDCDRRAALVALGWCAAEVTSLAIKYAVLWRRAVDPRTIAADLATLGGLVGLALLVQRLSSTA